MSAVHLARLKGFVSDEMLSKLACNLRLLTSWEQETKQQLKSAFMGSKYHANKERKFKYADDNGDFNQWVKSTKPIEMNL